MAWSGGTFSRAHDWTTDAAGAFPNIEASRMDTEDDNFASGIDSCLHKGGQNAMTGDLNMNGNGLINADQVEIQDSLGTDTMTITHDGADAHFAFVNTTDLNVRDGVIVKVWDSGDADFLALSHDGTDAFFTSANTNAFRFQDATFMRLDDGMELRVYDPTNTDFMAISHNGTDAEFEFGTTTDLNFRDGVIIRHFDSTDTVGSSITQNTTQRVVDLNVAAGQMIWRNQGAASNFQWYTDGVGSGNERLRLSSGVAYFLNNPSLRVYDAGNTKYLSVTHDGSTAVLDANGDPIYIKDSALLRDGAVFRVYDGTNADYLEISHDGVDATISAVSTSRVNFTGADIETPETILIKSDASALRLGAGEDVDTLFNGTSYLVQTAGASKMIEATPNAGVAAYYNGNKAFGTSSVGASVIHPTSTTPQLDFTGFTSVTYGNIQATAVAMTINGEVHGGNLTLRAEDTGGIARTGLDIDPDALTVLRGDTGFQLQVTPSGTVRFEANATGIGFFAATPVAKPTVSGSRAGNLALLSLTTQLANLGLITDSTTA